MPVQPSCFGKRWDPNETACKGGLDPLYAHPVTGTKYRDKCSWFNSCSQAMQHTQPARPAQPQLITPTSLLQKTISATPSIRPPTMPMAHMPPAPPQQTTVRPSYTPLATAYSLPSTHSPPAPPVPTAVPTTVTMPQYQAQQAQPFPMYPQGFAPPNVAQYGPAMVAMPYQHPASQMPQYLTVPEPSNDNVHWALRLGRELFRSMVKAFGHQLAAHVDSHSIKRHN